MCSLAGLQVLCTVGPTLCSASSTGAAAVGFRRFPLMRAWCMLSVRMSRAHPRRVSLVFAHYVLGLSGALDAASSQRVQGIARATFLMKRKRQSKPPLTQGMVRSLEMLVCNPSGRPMDRYVAGFFLVCIYMRARYSDGLHMQDLSREVAGSSSLDGYLEAQVMRSKTSYTIERKVQALPMAAPLHGLTSLDWVAEWLQVRSDLQVPAGPGIPLLVERAASGGWSRTPPSAGVAGAWLRGELLRSGPTARTPVRQLACLGPASSGSIPITNGHWAITLPLETAWSTFTLGMPLRQRCESWTRSSAWCARAPSILMLGGLECLLGAVFWLRVAGQRLLTRLGVRVRRRDSTMSLQFRKAKGRRTRRTWAWITRGRRLHVKPCVVPIEILICGVGS